MDFFYYHSDHHEPLRKGGVKGSKSAYDRRSTHLARDGREAYSPYNECRVLVKISLKDVEAQVPA
jgi:hypothetical protein